MSERSRIFIDPGQVDGGIVCFHREGLRHIATVLRLGHGDELRATDGKGKEYLLRLQSSEGQLRGVVVGMSSPRRESPLRVILVQALPKKDLMDVILQKAVELGVSEIWPVKTARSVVTLKGEREKVKRERWMKIVEASLAQSGRTVRPLINDVLTWKECLGRRAGVDLKLLLWEGEERGLGGLIESSPLPSSVLLAVGPEGGWEDNEVSRARQAGFVTAGLGPRTLRTETAALAALSILQFLFGDLAGRGCEKEHSEKESLDL